MTIRRGLPFELNLFWWYLLLEAGTRIEQIDQKEIA